MAALDLPRHGIAATLAGVACHTRAWRLQNTSSLRAIAARVRENDEVAGANGRRGNQGRLDQRLVDLSFFVIGDVDQDGTPNANGWEGAEVNVAYLEANVYLAAQDANGCVPCTVTLPPFTYAGPVQLDNWEVQPGPDEASRYVFLSVVIPAGQLVRSAMGGGG